MGHEQDARRETAALMANGWSEREAMLIGKLASELHMYICRSPIVRDLRGGEHRILTAVVRALAGQIDDISEMRGKIRADD